MKTLWILAAAATFAACASKNEDDVGAAPDRGDTTAVTTEVDTATGTWDTTGATGEVNAEPSDTAMTPTTPGDTSVGQYPTPGEAAPDTSSMDPSMPAPTPTDTGAYVPDPSSAGTDSTSVDPNAGAVDPNASIDSAGVNAGGMSADPTSFPPIPAQLLLSKQGWLYLRTTAPGSLPGPLFVVRRGLRTAVESRHAHRRSRAHISGDDLTRSAGGDGDACRSASAGAHRSVSGLLLSLPLCRGRAGRTTGPTGSSGPTSRWLSTWRIPEWPCGC